MRDRLYRWLEALAVAPEAEAVEFLCERGLNAAAARAALPAARGLFERVLMSTPGPMITTFHGWFLHLLERAPLQARGPTALMENTALLAREAWLTYAQSLDAREGNDQERAMRALLAEFPITSVRELLFAFVQRRAEWWAWAPRLRRASMRCTRRWASASWPPATGWPISARLSLTAGP